MSTEAWRGVASESADDVAGGLAGFLRARSRRLLGSLLRPHKRALAGIGAVIVVQNIAAMSGPFLVRLGIDRGIPPLVQHRGARTLAFIVVAYLIAATVQAVGTRVFLWQTGRIGQTVLFDLRMRLFDHFQRLSLSFHERYTSGRVVARLTTDIEAISELLDTGMNTLVYAGLSILTTGVILVVIDRPLGLIAVAGFVPLLVLTVWFRNESEKAYRASREAVALTIVHFNESLGGIRAVQAFNREPRNQEIFDAVNGRYMAANKRSMRLAGVYGPGIRAIGSVTTTSVLLVGGLRVLDGSTTIGVLAAVLLYLRRFFEPMQDLSQFFNIFQSAASGLEKLSGVLEEEPAVAQAAHPRPLAAARGRIDFVGLDFSYRPNQPVLEQLDLTIPSGETLALVGETGSGKTTIARLVARFYDPIHGAVLLDGVDLRDLAWTDLRRAVVMVTQENYLFSGTVADNIAFGRPTATRREIEAAAEAIGAGEFIGALPDGFDTDVRKRGSRLSAGQRQLVAFARAFLADPRVLILDEATSSLDIPSERLVQQALTTLLADRTAIIIAHRLSTVEIADRVIVLDHGAIVERGAPRDLLTRDGSYRALHQAWENSLV
jgi:ABC-type multidrug transport system fused ATPase/permease subunit